MHQDYSGNAPPAPAPTAKKGRKTPSVPSCLGGGGLGDNSVYGVSVCSKTIYFAAFAARLKTYMFPMYPSSQTDDPVGMIPNENVKSCI